MVENSYETTSAEEKLRRLREELIYAIGKKNEAEDHLRLARNAFNRANNLVESINERIQKVAQGQLEFGEDHDG